MYIFINFKKGFFKVKFVSAGFFQCQIQPKKTILYYAYSYDIMNNCLLVEYPLKISLVDCKDFLNVFTLEVPNFFYID